MKNWRLLPFLSASGNIQMAVDRWLLEQHIQGLYPPTLRFYTWSPPAISLGYHQHKYPPDWQQLTWQGQQLDLVRRPTGGRAVLHQGDLTYAVVTSGLGGSRVQAYQEICEFLIQGWRSLGVELHYGTAGRGYIHNPNCFGTATVSDLVTKNGAKLIGSAQLRRGDAVLQHGSIRLQPDVELFQQVFGDESLMPQIPEVEVEAVMAALMAAAENCFGMKLELRTERSAKLSLTDDEWQAILRAK